MTVLYPQRTPEDLEELRRRNAERLAEAKQRLGNRYLLHPAHALQRKSTTMRTTM